MARLSLFSVAFLLLLTFIFAIEASHVNSSGATYHLTGGEGSLKSQECEGACNYRCSATSHKKPCLFFCNKCCKKCLCVPSGTHGNKRECPCYNNWKTKRGGPKCP